MGGTIIQEAVIDKIGCDAFKRAERARERARVWAYRNKTTCRSDRSVEKRPCMKLSRADGFSVSRSVMLLHSLERLHAIE